MRWSGLSIADKESGKSAPGIRSDAEEEESDWTANEGESAARRDHAGIDTGDPGLAVRICGASLIGDRGGVCTGVRGGV